MIIIQTAFILSDDRLRGIGERGKEKEIKGMVIRRNEVVSWAKEAIDFLTFFPQLEEGYLDLNLKK